MELRVASGVGNSCCRVVKPEGGIRSPVRVFVTKIIHRNLLHRNKRSEPTFPVPGRWPVV